MKKVPPVSAKANITPFFNREKELEMLEKLYEKAKTQAQFLVLYGKRRVGKTELVKHLFTGKPNVYYLASRISAQDQLKTVSDVIADYFKADYLKATGFANWRDLFTFLGERLKGSQERLILIFDEFPYLVEGDKGVSSHFQYGWDEHLKDAHVLLVLLGSSISMMYKHALIYSAPLYGRRTASWRLEPFSFTQSKNFYKKSDDFEKVFAFYAIAGGIPAYLKEFNEEKTLWEVISEKILTKGTLLYTEPELLISEELKEPRKYLSILKAIGFGRTKFGEIVNASRLEPNTVTKYLSILINLKFVKREVPVTEKHPEKSKKGIYTLADSFFRFYYSFIFPHLSAFESERKEFFLERIKKRFPYFISKVYEDTTKEFVEQLWQEKLTPLFPLIGRWWDKDTEIDLVGLNEEENAILFVETKWNKKPLGRGVLRELKQKSQKVKWGKERRKEYFALVAKGGFSEGLVREAQRAGVILILEDKIYSPKTNKDKKQLKNEPA